jgi:hypothetical protein
MMAMNQRLLRPLASGRFGALRVGLVAYWPFEEDASSGDVTAVDWTGRGNDLTSNNTVLSATGKVGSAREFVAANSEYMDRASNTDLQFGDGAWTIACWVFAPSSPDQANSHIIGKDQSGGREFILTLGVNATTNANRFGATIFHSSGTFVQVTGPVAANADFTNLWHHVAIVHDGAGVVSGYQNGALFSGTNAVPTATRGAGLAFAATGTPFNVGRRSFSGSPIHCTAVVDELAKWSRALSATEVAALWNSGNGIDLRR